MGAAIGELVINYLIISETNVHVWLRNDGLICSFNTDTTARNALANTGI